MIRYRDSITPLKRYAAVEKAVLNAFLRHPICARKLSELGKGDFARYRDERLEEVTPSRSCEHLDEEEFVVEVHGLRLDGVAVAPGV